MYIWPQSRLGWWGFGAASLSIVMFVVNRSIFPTMAQTADYFALLSVYELTTFVVGMSGSICAIVAWRWHHDGAWAVRLSLVPLVVFILGLLSLLIPPA